MSIRHLILAVCTTTALAHITVAQESQTQPPPREAPPAECPAPSMTMRNPTQSGQPMATTMTEAQRGYLQSMMKMRGPMQAGITAKDPDLAFICGMIPHHQGAVDMAEVVLRTGNDPKARKFAEKVIRDQGREIAWMRDWLKTYAREHGK